MRIKRQLKHVRFEYDFDSKTLSIVGPYEAFDVSRIEMFSLARFILRVSQKGVRKNVKNKSQ